MKRVTYKSIIERQQKSGFSDLPKLKDIIVDLSVRNKPTDKVVKKLRIVGLPIEFIEYSDKKRSTTEKGKFDKTPFPDADRNTNFTRIGHENPSECPWKAAGFVGAKKYAVRCLEETEDSEGKVIWKPMILCKGPSIFGEFATWEQGRSEEDDADISNFLGGDGAPSVKVQATKDDSKLGGVDYKVFVGAKDMKLTEAMINQFREIHEPSADELNALRTEYNADREIYPDLPEWRDYFEFGYDLRRIFKFTPPVEDATTKSAQEPSTDHVLVGSTEEELTSSEDKDDLALEDINW